MLCQIIVSVEVCLAGLRKLRSLLNSEVINYKFLAKCLLTAKSYLSF